MISLLKRKMSAVQHRSKGTITNNGVLFLKCAILVSTYTLPALLEVVQDK